MHLTKMRFGGIPPFTQPVEFRFDPRVNVFVGPNATGKSRLLSEIDYCFNRKGSIRPERIDSRLHIRKESGYGEDWAKNLLCADADFVDAYFLSHGNPKPPAIYLGPIREGLPRISDLDDAEFYGSTAEEVLSGPFCGTRLAAAVEALHGKYSDMFENENKAREEDSPIERRAWNFLYIDTVSHACAKDICNELIASERALNYPTGLDLEFIADQPVADFEGLSINRLLGISTGDIPTFEHIPPEERPIDLAVTSPKRIYVGDLSSGSQSTLLWVWWLALKMLNHYEFANGWNQKPAILLIDEIENHLHPTWQRRVIPALLNHFPGLQIFATTHSPFVVAGLRAGQVHMLKRDANGVVTATTNDRDIIGWTTDEILRTFMNVDEPTDQLTVDRTNRLRELRGMETLSDAESEELAQLRRQINDDFISSSTPLEAQRERYGEMMLEFLRSRQSELSQED